MSFRSVGQGLRRFARSAALRIRALSGAYSAEELTRDAPRLFGPPPPTIPGVEIVPFNTYLERFHRELFERESSLCLRNEGRSIWLRRSRCKDGCRLPHARTRAGRSRRADDHHRECHHAPSVPWRLVTTESDGARIASCRGLPSRPTSCGPASPLPFGALGFSVYPARRRFDTALYCQLLVSAPGLFPCARRLPRLLDRGMDDLAIPRGEGMPRHFPDTFLVAETIAHLKQHRQDFERLGSHARESSIDPHLTVRQGISPRA